VVTKQGGGASDARVDRVLRLFRHVKRRGLEKGGTLRTTKTIRNDKVQKGGAAETYGHQSKRKNKRTP